MLLVDAGDLLLNDAAEGLVVQLPAFPGTLYKMAQGKMVRFLAQNQITNPKDRKAFYLLDFQYTPEYWDESNSVFLRK